MAKREIDLWNLPVPGKDYDISKLPTGHLSVSQIETYLFCPLQYYAQRILKIPVRKSIQMVEGQMWAKLLEESNKLWLKTGKHLSEGSALTKHSKIVTQMAPKIDDWFGETRKDIKNRGAAFIDQYWNPDGPDMEPCHFQWGNPGEKSKTYPGTEARIRTEIAGVTIEMVPDLVEEGCVIDFKVVKNRNTARRYYSAKNSLQLHLYGSVLERERIGYVFFLKEEGQIHEDFVNIDVEESYSWVEMTVSRVAHAICTGAFPPCKMEEFLCAKGWCNAWDHCRGKEV